MVPLEGVGRREFASPARGRAPSMAKEIPAGRKALPVLVTDRVPPVRSLAPRFPAPRPAAVRGGPPAVAAASAIPRQPGEGVVRPATGRMGDPPAPIARGPVAWPARPALAEASGRPVPSRPVALAPAGPRGSVASPWRPKPPAEGSGGPGLPPRGPALSPVGWQDEAEPPRIPLPPPSPATPQVEGGGLETSGLPVGGVYLPPAGQVVAGRRPEDAQALAESTGVPSFVGPAVESGPSVSASVGGGYLAPAGVVPAGSRSPAVPGPPAPCSRRVARPLLLHRRGPPAWAALRWPLR